MRIIPIWVCFMHGPHILQSCVSVKTTHRVQMVFIYCFICAYKYGASHWNAQQSELRPLLLSDYRGIYVTLESLLEFPDNL